ncbi:phosphatidylserine decarboxylase proenzyme, putative [Eimeria acervulina]|uniref:Phosphatidylserine decarboxylase proenzyme, putative n=1 Tax=Eimeria acervulina TaxID=5801 RepID=U6GY46_EIMAC|nr:phosphatidylserine decarboxylase proenzyme, putative [Eimeria acervulina]CDI84158.1 phosphatidylserine decarboxylase proenzyme, putative [Eimeria acervulina]
MYCVLHLAPHHYHHFHAPCDFTQTDIFSVQERVILSGTWIGGGLHVAAVAACNVGDIRLEKEPDLRTNQDRVVLRHLGGDVDIRTYRGSTIVLVFEAPHDFEFSVAAGDKIRAGSRLGGVGPPVVAKDESSRKFIHY